MDFPRAGGASFQQGQSFLDDQFDIFAWYPYLQSCVRYFLDHAQYNSPVQALAAFVNIRLPFQKMPHPVLSSRPAGSPTGGHGPALLGSSARAAGKLPHMVQQPLASVSLLPYIRRLIATGCDNPAVLHGFFGDDWSAGIGWLHEQERRNYLFAAKSDNWLKVKVAYDMSADETIPFLRPLQNVTEKEIVAAETAWSEWLAMQDWMLGPRAPDAAGDLTETGMHGRRRRGHDGASGSGSELPDAAAQPEQESS